MRRVSLLSIALLACAPGTKHDVNAGAGDSLFADGKFAAARQAYRDELRRTPANSPARAHLLTSVAFSAYRLSDYDEARRLGDSALALLGPSVPMADAFRVHNVLGLVAWDQGRIAEADSLFRSALRIANDAHDTAGIAKASANLSLVFTDYGEFERARSALLTARDAAHAVGNRPVEGNTNTNLAMLSLRTGDIPEAEREVDEALAVYRAAHYETGEENALGQLATIEEAKGEGQAAFVALDSALVIARREGLKQEEASDLEVLGDLYADAGDLRAAGLYYDQAERTLTALGAELEAANLLRARGELDAAHGDTAAAQHRAAAALAIHSRLGARAEEVNDRLTIAELTPANEAAAARELDSADALARSLGSSAAEARTVLARARYEERDGSPRGVLQILSTDAKTHRLLDRASLWERAALRLRAWARVGQLDSAEAAGREAVRLVEQSRGSYGSAELRTAFGARMAQVYTDLVLVLLRKGNIGGAFEIADAARGRALVEHLASARAQLAGNSAPALFVDGEVLATRIDSLVARLEAAERHSGTQRGVGESSVHRDLIEQLGQARSEYEAMMGRVASDDDAELLGLTTMGLPRVQASLAPDEAVVDYLSTPDTLLAFVVTRNRITVARTPARETEVSAHARVVRELLGSRTAPTDETPASEALFDLLISPAQRTGALASVSRLVIVPHEALSYVPFAALRDRSNGKALVDEYVLTYLPSAAALPVLRGRGAATQQGAASGPAGESVALAPFTGELPATAAEARSVAARLPNAVTLLGKDATERKLRATLGAHGVVHVATHAELNLRNPMFSQIRLAPGSGSPDDDGRLEVYEIFGLRVRSPLVFLSGCETGVGSAWSTDFERGEDYAMLARAFLYAGARNVVATLWPIDDAGAAAFADRYYLYRRDGDEAQALARAQRAMMRDARYRSPYYWAGYQLSGAGR